MDLRSGRLVRQENEEMEIELDLPRTAEIRTSEPNTTDSQRSNEGEGNVMSFLENMMRKIDNNTQESNRKLEESTRKIEENGKKLEKKMDKNTEEAKQNGKKLEEKMDNNTRKVEESVNKLTEEMDKIRQEMQIQLEKKNEEIRKEITEKLETEKKGTLNIIKDVQETVTRNREHTDREIEDVRRQVEEKMKGVERTNLTEKIQVVVNPNMFRGDSDLRFYGDGRIHPVVFLKQLIERIEETEDNEDYRKIVRRMLKGKAEVWFDLIEERCDTWDEFQRQFTDYCWGDQAQSKVRERLYTGRYEESYGMNREEYAMRQIGMARYLDPPMHDKDIIQYIARHYKEEIRDVIAIQGIETIDNLLSYLKRVDSIKPVRRKYDDRGQGGNANQNNNNSNPRVSNGTNGNYQGSRYNPRYRPRFETKLDTRRPGNYNYRREEGRALYNNIDGERTQQNNTFRNNGGERRYQHRSNEHIDVNRDKNRNENVHYRPAARDENRNSGEYRRRETRGMGRDFVGQEERERRQQNYNVQVKEISKIVESKNQEKEQERRTPNTTTRRQEDYDEIRVDVKPGPRQDFH